MPRVVSVGTAVPPYEIKQEEARELARQLFQESYPNLDRLLTIFENTAIQSRRFSKPRDWFQEDHSFREKNQAYVESACQLGEEAIQKALKLAGLDVEDVDHFIFVSTTGMATPSIDAHLIHRLGMNQHVKRTPIWGLGCAGGVAGLSRAYEYARAFPESRVLLLALECCGLTFRRRDHSKSNLVATSLFSDGAAAVLVAGEEAAFSMGARGPKIMDTMSMIWPNSLDVMGWDLMDDGLKVIFSRDIPTLVRSRCRSVLESFLERHQLNFSEIDHYIAHPGGRKVLDAFEEALGIPGDRLSTSHRVLERYGNMSSATVLFVLEQVMRNAIRPQLGLMTALGPGFSLEMCLLKWEESLEPLKSPDDSAHPDLRWESHLAKEGWETIYE